MNTTPLDDYAKNVILAWDEASGNFKAACQSASREYSLASKLGILAPDWETILLNSSQLQTITAVKETIDGVWTKVQIYQNQFEHMFKEWEVGSLATDAFRNTAIDLWTRMLMDLIAMNADDLRNGEIAIGVTDIIDINFLVWPKPEKDKRRWNILQETLSEAFKEVIKITRIAITAWETAVLGESPKTSRLYKLIENDAKKIKDILTEYIDTTANVTRNNIIESILREQEEYVTAMKKEIHFNIWWTALWLKTAQNLLKLEDESYSIVALHETPKNWIIGPRSNGITKIREDMESLLWEWWENKDFSDFIDVLWDEKAKKIDETVRDTCKGKKMWEIATWQTTVFNPFVANTVLGGLNGTPIARVVKLIHVTWNPLKKIVEWVGDSSYKVEMDMSRAQIPQIIALLQIAYDMDDTAAMNKWNMWVPYVLVVHPDDVHTILSVAHEHNIAAQVVWKVEKSHLFDDNTNTIQWVGIGNTTVTF